MHFELNDEELAFRDSVREFVRTKLPESISRKIFEGQDVSRDDMVTWQKVLAAQGWGGVGWPKQFGGPGWSAMQMHIFDEESALAGAPRLNPFGLRMVAPVIMAFGTAQQQQRYLPKIASGEEWWCQGYSEPGSGSDLASLKTRAVRDGDSYVVSGQKTWNTLGQFADWIFCLVRTDPQAKLQEGISFLLISMKTPGVTLRPIKLLDGSVEVNDVFFDQVRVPIENRIGDENRGWTYAKFLLGHERTNIAGVGIAKRELRRLRRIAGEERKNGKPLIDDPLFAARVAQIEADLMALELTTLRTISAEKNKRAPGPEASVLKVRGTEIQQAISELTMLAVGPYALPWRREALEAGYQVDPNAEVGPPYAATAASRYFNWRKLSIFGGTNEIQKNIISKMMVGL
ncbi:MAG TPA: acyl-CoA dehydrogenase family protein [Steroidobacteraceae bacterium]|jgi:alkylation response protein AidB-like acyl-CoA dehydrogenase|nr:acyl-CoA dehydrogenase family protein [Steroidobacteraceae bacterium]